MSKRKSRHINIWVAAVLVLAAGLSACGPRLPAGVSGEVALSPLPSISPSPTVTLPSPRLSTPTSTVTPRPSPTLPPSSTPTVTLTPDPYAGLSVDSLTGRDYGGGSLQAGEVLATNSFYTRTLFSYPSDGLTIYGFMNTPIRAQPPFPVVIALHGYIDPQIYQTVDYTTRYADALGRAGYLVLHPNLRGYPPSDEGDNLFRIGMAVDVLNLVAIVRATAGQPGPLLHADPDRIGLWGHSMGGGVTTRVITVDPDIRAALLYGAMSGDEQKNFERIFNYFSSGERGAEELAYPPEAFERISPLYYLDRIQAAVSIHHGDQDGEVPLAWSLDLCRRLDDLGKAVECFTYAGQPHTFHGDGDELFMQRMVDFFNRQLASGN